MKQVNGIWLPDTEQHMIDFISNKSTMIDGRGTYQYKKLKRALSFCKQFRSAIDIGAHVGTWSIHLSKAFEHVYCFEPMQDHRACWLKNLGEVGRVNKCSLYKYALGNSEGNFWITSNIDSTGDTRIETTSDVGAIGRSRVEVEMHKLDTFELRDIDLIKVDCEGYELHILEGGEQTLKINKPLVVVEQKPGRGEKYGLNRTAACDYLESLGAKRLDVMSGDYFYGW